MNTAPTVVALTDEHRDGTIYGDIEGDIWTPHPWGGWITSRRGPFGIVSQVAHPGVEYGPYRAVLPPRPQQEDM